MSYKLSQSPYIAQTGTLFNSARTPRVMGHCNYVQDKTVGRFPQLAVAHSRKLLDFWVSSGFAQYHDIGNTQPIRAETRHNLKKQTVCVDGDMSGNLESLIDLMGWLIVEVLVLVQLYTVQLLWKTRTRT